VIGKPIPTPRRPPNEQLRHREFLTAQEEPAIFALSRACIARGTGSSNPSPSSGQSVSHTDQADAGRERGFRAGVRRSVGGAVGGDAQALVGAVRSTRAHH